jgi:hypothetical protein
MEVSLPAVVQAVSKAGMVALPSSGQFLLADQYTHTAGYHGPLFSFTQICYDAYMQETASGITETL